MDQIQGFIATPFVPLNADFSLNTVMIEPYAQHLKNSGVAGVLVNGTTGEGYSLTAKERMEVAEAWMHHADGQFLVIVHVGAEGIAVAKKLASHAQSIGVDAIASMSPVCFRPCVGQLVEWCREIASCAAETRFYYSHIPQMTGATFAVPELPGCVQDEVLTFRGLSTLPAA